MPTQAVDISGLAENEELIAALGAGLSAAIQHIAVECANRQLARLEPVIPVDKGNLKRGMVVNELPDGAEVRDDVFYGVYQWKGTRYMQPNAEFAAELDAAPEHILADATEMAARLLNP